MSKSNAFEGDWLDHFFLNVAIANVGDATGLPASATAGQLFVSLHSADPGEGGDQTTNELSYSGYARVGVARSGAGWTRSGNNISNAAEIVFPIGSGATQTARFWGIGTSSSGSGRLRYSGAMGGAARVFTADTADNFACPGHAFAVDDKVVVEAMEGISLPTGVTDGTQYWIKTQSAGVFTLSATQGGATLDVTAVGAGRIRKATPLDVSAGVTPKFAIGQLQVIED